MLDITSFILENADNISVAILILAIVVAITLCLYNYKLKLKEYILNERNVGYVAFLILSAGVLFFLIEKSYIREKWAFCNIFLWGCYLIIVICSLKPKINYFSHPVLKYYAKKLYAGEILENIEFFEKNNHWFIQEKESEIEYRLLQAKYFSAVQSYDKAYRTLNLIDEKYLYKEESIFVNRKKAIQLTQMGAMSAALLLLGKPEECNSKDPFVWIAYSYIYEQQGDIVKAMEYASKAKDLLDLAQFDVTDIAQIYNDYGRIALMYGNKQETLFYYRHAYRMVESIKDMRVYVVLTSNLIIHMAIAGESREKCEELLYEFKNKIQKGSIGNLLEYNNCAITYYRQIMDEESVFATIKHGYYEVIDKLSHEQSEIYKASTFRMIMNGRFIHDWFDDEINTNFKDYEDLPPLSRLIIFKEYMGILSQPEFYALLRYEKYRNLHKMILEYYQKHALEDVDSCLANIDSVNINLYKETIMLKLGVLRFIQKENHIELSKQEYFDLSNKLYDAGLRIDGTFILSVFIDTCASRDNLLVKMPQWPKTITFSQYVEWRELPEEPQKLPDGIHLIYKMIDIPLEMQIKCRYYTYISENIETIISEFNKWKEHPAKVEMSTFITHILICLNRREEARMFYQYHKNAGISELQFASWFRNQLASQDDLFGGKK